MIHGGNPGTSMKEDGIAAPGTVAPATSLLRYSAARTLLAAACAGLLSAPAPAQRIEPAQTALINPRAIAVNPVTHRMYAVDEPAGRVNLFDGVTGASKSIPVGKAPDALAIDPVTNRIYVVNSGSDTVSVIDGATETVAATVRAGRMPYAIQIDPPLHKVFVTNTYSGFVTEIDETSNQTTSLPLGAKDAIAIDTKLHRVYLLGYEDPALTVFDEGSQTTHRASASVMHLWGLSVDEPRGIVYATEAQDKGLFAVHESSGTRATVSTGAMPCAASVDPRNGMVYVLNYADNSVTVIDGVAGKVVATIPVGDRPEAIAVDAAKDLIYVANTHSDNVTVIDGRSRKVIATLPGGRNPYAIAIDPVSGDVYVANFGAPSFTRLQTASLHR